jgi:hypothetical protein
LFWVAAPCRHVGKCCRLEGTYCLHIQGWSELVQKWMVW